MSGKSTLLNIISGIQPIDTKTNAISINERPIDDCRELQSMSTFLSNDDKMFPEFSIWDNIRIALPRTDHSSENERRTACAEFLGQSDIFSNRSVDDPLGDLSTGGRALVKFCRAHVSSEPVVIVDELTSYLDDARAAFFLERTMELVGHGAAVLIVSHSERDRSYLKERGSTLGIQVAELSVERENNVSEVHIHA